MSSIEWTDRTWNVEAHVSVATLCAACHGPIPEGRRRGSERKHCSPACRREAARACFAAITCCSSTAGSSSNRLAGDPL